MQKKIQVLVLITVLLAAASVQGALPDLKGYTQAVSEYFKADADQVQEVASYLPRTDELPVAYMVAMKAGVDPVVVAEKRYDGQKWQEILQQYGLGSDLFRMEVRGFVPSSVYQPILDKFPDDQPAAWKTAPLTDRDILNMANLKFISDHYGYSMYRVMAMRDKGRSFPQIQTEAWAVAQGPQGKQKTATAGF